MSRAVELEASVDMARHVGFTGARILQLGVQEQEIHVSVETSFLELPPGPGLCHTVLTLAAFDVLGPLIAEHDGDRQLAQTREESWSGCERYVRLARAANTPHSGDQETPSSRKSPSC